MIDRASRRRLSKARKERENLAFYSDVVATPSSGPVVLPAGARFAVKALADCNAGTSIATFTGTSTQNIVSPQMSEGDLFRFDWLEKGLTVEMESGFELYALDAYGQPIVPRPAALLVDFFGTAGQSNAVGQGDEALSPDASSSGLYFDGVNFLPLNDPVGNANTGSAWPAFANEWFALTGRIAVFVACATGSTRLLDYGDPNLTWAPTGNLRGPAAARMRAAINAIHASEEYTLNSAFVDWSQGEGDAENLDVTHTAAMYKEAQIEIADWFKEQIPELTGFAIIRSALNINDATKDAGYAAIRAAQEEACAESDLLIMAYRGTYSFRTLGWMATNVHYTQPGLNQTGKCAARGVYSPAAPATLSAISATAYTDTDYATSATITTKSHTTAVGTKWVGVAVAPSRPNSSSTSNISSVTIGGVAMSLSRVVSDNGVTASRATAGIYYIDEATYGGSLSGITADIVVTTSQAANLVELVVFNSPDDLYPDYAISANLTPSDSSAALSLTYYTGAPALTIAVASSAGPGAAAATCVLTNVANEVLDAGGSNGTRSGQACIGYSIDSAEYGPRTITATFSANQNAIALAVGSFRKRISGE